MFGPLSVSIRIAGALLAVTAPAMAAESGIGQEAVARPASPSPPADERTVAKGSTRVAEEAIAEAKDAAPEAAPFGTGFEARRRANPGFGGGYGMGRFGGGFGGPGGRPGRGR